MIPRRAPLPSTIVAVALLGGCSLDSNAVPASGATGTGGTSSSTSSAGGAGGAGTGATGGAGTGGSVDPTPYLHAPLSCAYDCPNTGCAEQATPYACPAAGAWASIPHEAACPSWDGTYPTPVTGHCTATAPTGAALSRTGAVAGSPGARVLPDGRTIQPAGSEWAFDEAAQSGGETHSIAAVPGTSFVVTVDTGDNDHAVRVVDTSLIGSGNSPVVGFVKFAPPSYLNDGVAVLPSGRVYVATGFGVVQALDVDLTTGALTQDDAASLTLPTSTAMMAPFYALGLAASPDGTHLVVGSVFDTLILVFDVDPASPTYQKQVGQLDLGQKEIYAVPSTRTTRPARTPTPRSGAATRSPRSTSPTPRRPSSPAPSRRTRTRRAWRSSTRDGWRSPTTSARPSPSATG